MGEGITFTHAVWLSTGDLDRDGDPDIVGASLTQGLVWWANNGDGTAWTEHLITKREFYEGPSLALADLDADGDLDVVGGTGSPSANLEIALSDFATPISGFHLSK